MYSIVSPIVMSDLDLELNLILEPGVSTFLDEERVSRLARFVLDDSGQTGRWAVALVLTTDERLRQLHNEFMGIDSTTDVMTFPSDPVEGESDDGGDIVISVERADEQGPEAGLSKGEEIEFLLVHGLLHLCGWDDDDEDDRARMLAYQAELIRKFNDCQRAAV